MPIYEYKCNCCGDMSEQLMSVKEYSASNGTGKQCAKCKEGVALRVIKTAPNVHSFNACFVGEPLGELGGRRATREDYQRFEKQGKFPVSPEEQSRSCAITRAKKEAEREKNTETRALALADKFGIPSN